jgi:hypothetical protein
MKVIVIHTCKADGKRHMPGEKPVEISDEAAKLLIESGAVREAAPASTKPTNPDELAGEIKGAIDSLSKEDASLWNADGSAKVGAISAVLGYQVTKDERDAALAADA